MINVLVGVVLMLYGLNVVDKVSVVAENVTGGPVDHQLPIYERIGYTRDHYNLTDNTANSSVLNRIDKRLSNVIDLEQEQVKKMDSLENKIKLLDIYTQQQADNLRGELKQLSQRVQNVEATNLLPQGTLNKLSSTVDHVKMQLGTGCVLTCPLQNVTTTIITRGTETTTGTRITNAATNTVTGTTVTQTIGNGMTGTQTTTGTTTTATNIIPNMGPISPNGGGNPSVENKLNAIADLLQSTRTALEQVQQSVGKFQRNITDLANANERIQRLQQNLADIQKNVASLQGTKDQIDTLQRSLNQLRDSLNQLSKAQQMAGNVPTGGNAPYGANPPFGGNMPYGTNPPYGGNMPYGGNPPYGTNNPFGGNPPYGGNVPNGGFTPTNPPYGGQVPSGANTPPTRGPEEKPKTPPKQPNRGPPQEKQNPVPKKAASTGPPPTPPAPRPPPNPNNNTWSPALPENMVPSTLPTFPPLTPFNGEPLPCSCSEIAGSQSGIYRIQLANGWTTYVQCDLETNSNKWTVVMNRQDGSTNFFRNWNDYRNGFGNIYNEFWIGLEKLYQLSSQALHELLVEMEDFNGVTRYARYTNFGIGNEGQGYPLSTLGPYFGDAGDSLSYHAGQKFSTFDNDNDAWPNGNCAQSHMGGWWYRACDMCNLLGRYPGSQTNDLVGNQGMYWNDFSGIRRAKMMIRQIM